MAGGSFKGFGRKSSKMKELNDVFLVFCSVLCEFIYSSVCFSNWFADF